MPSRARTHRLALLALVAFVACSSRFEGAFEGSMREWTSLSVVEASGALRTIEHDRTEEGVEVVISKGDDRVFEITMPGCAAQAMRFGDRLELGGDKTCQVKFDEDGWTADLELAGNARFERGKLIVEITGTSGDRTIGGSHRWTFEGTKSTK